MFRGFQKSPECEHFLKDSIVFQNVLNLIPQTGLSCRGSGGFLRGQLAGTENRAKKTRAFLSREIGFSQQIGVFLEKDAQKKNPSIFVEKNRLFALETRISRKISGSAWVVCVFLEKKARLRWLGAFLSRKRLDSDGWGRISREKS